MATPRRKSNNPDGRPSTGLAEAKVLVTGPEVLLGAVRIAAAAEGVSVIEWWRRAARVRLGWREVLPLDGQHDASASGCAE